MPKANKKLNLVNSGQDDDDNDRIQENSDEDNYINNHNQFK